MPVVCPDSQVTSITRHAPRWQVVLLNDDDHTYEYVILMLVELFRMTAENAFRLACEVDRAGRVVVEVTTKERAELKQEQIHAYGPDPLLPRSKGSMTAEIEPVAD